jgi:hypothetical protein
MTLENIREILRQCQELDGLESIYFEGGEPFLYYPVLVQGVDMAHAMGFQVGIVSNAYWATSPEDARLWLEPFAGKLSDLSVSSDLFHYSEFISRQARYASQAAQDLGIPVGMISIAEPQKLDAPLVEGQLPAGESGVMFRGRAAEKLAADVPHHPWDRFTACPYENLAEPGRVHVDPMGNLHVCQGIVIGNLFDQPLKAICQDYNPQNHPVVGPLIAGGPRRLVETYALELESSYADACHLCYQARQALRARFPQILAPDQMFGVVS